MKKLMILSVILLMGCLTISFSSCVSTSTRELFTKTDYFVDKLYTEYQSYGLMGMKYTETTESGSYTISPIGRLVNVKINNYVPQETYEKLMNILKRHYKGDSRVNDVYICQGGTVMIDCRN